MDKRKRYTPAEKVNLLRTVIEDGKAVSEVASENQVHPNMLLKWRKQMLEGAESTFTIKRPDISERAAEQRIKELEAKLVQRETLVAELAQENLQLKKNSNGRK